MKSIALGLPVDAVRLHPVRVESPLRRLVAHVRLGLARAAADGPLELSDTERLVRDAQSLRAAFLRGAKQDRE